MHHMVRYDKKQKIENIKGMQCLVDMPRLTADVLQLYYIMYLWI